MMKARNRNHNDFTHRPWHEAQGSAEKAPSEVPLTRSVVFVSGKNHF